MFSEGLAREENKGLNSHICLGLSETFQWIIRGRDFLVLPVWHLPSLLGGNGTPIFPQGGNPPSFSISLCHLEGARPFWSLEVDQLPLPGQSVQYSPRATAAGPGMGT